MFYSIMVYTIAFALSIINLHLINKKVLVFGGQRFPIINEIVRFIFVFFPIIIIYGWRFGVGVDFFTYLAWYNVYGFGNYVTSFASIFKQFLEPGYVLLNFIGGKILHMPNGIFVLCGIVICGLIYWLMKLYEDKFNPELMLFVFLMSYFGFACNGVRQFIAALIGLCGYKYLLDKEYKKYIIICLVAMLFHTSAIIMLMMLLFRNISDYDLKKFKTICVISGVIAVLFDRFIVRIIAYIPVLSKYSYTVGNGSFNFRDSISFLLYLVPTLVIMEYFKHRVDADSDINKCLAFFYLQIPFQCLGAMSISIERTSIYFAILQVIVMPAIVYGDVNYRAKKNRTVFLACTVWYLFYFIVMNVIIDGNGIFPYQFWNNM